MVQAALTVTGLRGKEKAAVLILSLSQETATKLFANMHDDEIREVSHAMATLGSIKAETVESLFKEFTSKIVSTSSLVGNVENTEKLLKRFMESDKVDQIMGEIRGPAGRTMWDKLSNVSEDVLANYLKNEYPQTVAVVLSKIKPEHAAKVLTVLPESFAMEVITRMLRMEVVQKNILSDIEMTLRTEFMSNLARTNSRDAHEVMADIFNHLDRNAEARFLGSLEQRNKESAERIRALMFTFADLKKLDGKSIQTLLRVVDKKGLALALKGASEEVRDLFFANMATRAAKILKEDMESLGPVRLRDVDEAQGAIVKQAKELAGKGEIMIADDKGDDELVY
ncbi:MAG: flagellar motor switch protein FliG [Alphaproteobacteria bacterium]